MNGTIVTPKRSKRERIHRFIDRYRIETGLAISAFLQAIIILFWFTPHLETDSLDSLVEEVAFIDNVQIQEPSTDSKPTDGDFDLTDKEKEEKKKTQELLVLLTPLYLAQPHP